jgi:hypothetical protein
MLELIQMRVNRGQMVEREVQRNFTSDVFMTTRYLL